MSNPAPIGNVTEELVFAVTNRSGLPFGVVSNVLFAAQAYQTELAAALAAVAVLPTAQPEPVRQPAGAKFLRRLPARTPR